MLLIHPPVAKPSEPPAGLARLAGALQGQGIPCRLLDASLEALLWLLGQPLTAEDTWSRRADRHRASHLAALRDSRTYAAPDRYSRAVSDLNRLLALAGRKSGAAITLADYRQQGFSPVRSADLLAAADRPERNPFYPWFSRRLPQLLDEGVTTVGFSLNYLSQAVCTFAMAGFLRRNYPEMTILLGGGLVTSWLQRPDWKSPFAGLVSELVAGPGEAFLLALYGIAEASAKPAIPCYDHLPLADYLAPGLILPYSASAGCYWNRCSFCPERAEGNRYRPLPVSRVLTELQQLVSRHRPSLVHLLDNALSPALLQGLTQSPPAAPWYGFARFGPELDDPDFCRSLRLSGCVMLKLGLESGDQGVLDRLEKGIDLSMAARILRNLKSAGIGVYLYLLFGTPAEDESAARRTLAFVGTHHEAISCLNLAIFNMPISGDEATDYASDLFYDGDLSLYTGFRHPAGWDRQKVRRFLADEFSRDPVVAAILRRDPPLFTSNHAPLFLPAFPDSA